MFHSLRGGWLSGIFSDRANSAFGSVNGDKTVATYIWIDGSGERLRSKVRVLDSALIAAGDAYTFNGVPRWDFDGSSTGQANTGNSDVYLSPVAVYHDPLDAYHNAKLVLCDTYDHVNQPTLSNNRVACVKTMESAADQHPWFGMEQEYFIVDQTTKRPIGWPKIEDGNPLAQGPYYCSVGADRAFGRSIADRHRNACLDAGLGISGTNGEVAPGQWEFQIGPVEGIRMADQLWIGRYLLHRVAEVDNCTIEFDPKPIVEGDWNGSGLHTNFSTTAMREKGGIEAIKAAVDKLRDRHAEHIVVYAPHEGRDNERRLTGEHETADIQHFTAGVGSRDTSIRIPRHCDRPGKKMGYLEDRRPASNADPYLVTKALVDTICL